MCYTVSSTSWKSETNADILECEHQRGRGMIRLSELFKPCSVSNILVSLQTLKQTRVQIFDSKLNWLGQANVQNSKSQHLNTGWIASGCGVTPATAVNIRWTFGVDRGCVAKLEKKHFTSASMFHRILYFLQTSLKKWEVRDDDIISFGHKLNVRAWVWSTSGCM